MLDVKELTTKNEWDNALEESLKNPVLIFKHSTSCPISAKAWQEYHEYLKDSPNTNVTYKFVKVIEKRPVSNQIAVDLGIKHQSPQAILINNKEAIWNDSHGKITKKQLHRILDHV